MFFLRNTVSDEKKVGHVLSSIGATACSVLRILLALTYSKDSDLATTKQKLVGHYKLKPPVIGWQFIFRQQTQKPGQLINQFLMELRHLTRICEFGQILAWSSGMWVEQYQYTKEITK